MPYWSSNTSRDPNSTTGVGNGERLSRDRSLLRFFSQYFLWLGLVCVIIFGLTLLKRKYMANCYLDLFVDSVSVSNNTIWNVSLVADSPSTYCKLSLFTANGRLLQGGKVVAESTTSYSYQQLVSHAPNSYIGFTTPKLDGVRDGHVVWGTGVEIIAGVERRRSRHRPRTLMVTCSELPVRFWSSPDESMKGSLVGIRKRCDYLFKSKLD